ncbi:hypothetical protein LHGZ1_2611 [Laribacter hongkongensis]|uniref:Uncharacterized protein n=1 Tax=Laribacter hongkongensis TaxID=168471 RepID=A0A248LLA0_9NEIS|nr:hypothetical protein LHGZ1_2611 [Laribacter hongkongensis]
MAGLHAGLIWPGSRARTGYNTTSRKRTLAVLPPPLFT